MVGISQDDCSRLAGVDLSGKLRPNTKFTGLVEIASSSSSACNFDSSDWYVESHVDLLSCKGDRKVTIKTNYEQNNRHSEEESERWRRIYEHMTKGDYIFIINGMCKPYSSYYRIYLNHDTAVYYFGRDGKYNYRQATGRPVQMSPIFRDYLLKKTGGTSIDAKPAAARRSSYQIETLKHNKVKCLDKDRGFIMDKSNNKKSISLVAQVLSSERLGSDMKTHLTSYLGDERSSPQPSLVIRPTHFKRGRLDQLVSTLQEDDIVILKDGFVLLNTGVNIYIGPQYVYQGPKDGQASSLGWTIYVCRDSDGSGRATGNEKIFKICQNSDDLVQEGFFDEDERKLVQKTFFPNSKFHDGPSQFQSGEVNRELSAFAHAPVSSLSKIPTPQSTQDSSPVKRNLEPSDSTFTNSVKYQRTGDEPLHGCETRLGRSVCLFTEVSHLVSKETVLSVGGAGLLTAGTVSSINFDVTPRIVCLHDRVDDNVSLNAFYSGDNDDELDALFGLLQVFEIKRISSSGPIQHQIRRKR